MTPEQIISVLEGIDPDDFEWGSTPILDEWRAKRAGAEFIEPILRFMENHPDIHYGMPGPIVHFVESCTDLDDPLYYEFVLSSVRRRPTFATIQLLNRLTNGARNRGQFDQKELFLSEMRLAQHHPAADEYIIMNINRYLDQQKNRDRG